MYQINDNYLKLPGSYLFSNIAKKENAVQEANKEKEIIRLGIGDVTQPLVPAIIEALHKAVDEMGNAQTFHGYAPDLGYEFLRNAIAKNDYEKRGAEIFADEIFISDGAKSDSANIQDSSHLATKARKTHRLRLLGEFYHRNCTTCNILHTPSLLAQEVFPVCPNPFQRCRF